MKNTYTSSSAESQEISEPFDSKKQSNTDYHYIKVPTYKGLQLSKSRVEWAIHNTESMTQAARLLGIAYNTFKKYAKQYDVFQVAKHSGPNKQPLHFDWNQRANDILEGKHPNYPIQKLQWLMLKEAKLVDVCYECNHQKKRVRDNKSPLMIDFIDKDHHNHQIDNLRMLCYNCYFLLDRPMIPMSKKYQEQKRMQDSLHHFKDKFDEALNEKTEQIDKQIEEQDEKEIKTKVEEFNWGDITMPTKF